MKSILRWLAVALVLPLLADWFYLDPLYRIITVMAPPRAEESLRLAEDDGHGAYCACEGKPTVFLGRDLPDRASYSVFEAWCEGHDGRLGWKS